MKAKNAFTSTPEFENFQNIMRRLLAVPKAELDRRVRAAKKNSPRKNNPTAPGRKKRT
jgi:hypothetical protein